MGKDPETQYLVTREPVDWNEAVTLALQCRKTHPDELIELIPKDDKWYVVRCVK